MKRAVRRAARIGKTDAGHRLAREAVEVGHGVYFATAPEMATQLHKAASDRRWQAI